MNRPDRLSRRVRGAVLLIALGLAACQTAGGDSAPAPDPGPPAEARALVRAVDLPGALPALMADLVTAGDRDNLRRPGYAEAVAEFDSAIGARRVTINEELAEAIDRTLTTDEQRAVSVWLTGEAAGDFVAEMRDMYLASWDEFQDTGNSDLDPDDPATLAAYGIEDPLMQRLFAATLSVVAEVIAETARQAAASEAGS